MEHYSHECKELKKTTEKVKDAETMAPGTSASAVEPDTECEGAWAAELIEDAIEEGPESPLLISKMDWFKEVIALRMLSFLSKSLRGIGLMKSLKVMTSQRMKEPAQEMFLLMVSTAMCSRELPSMRTWASPATFGQFTTNFLKGPAGC
jgi:hypothetical protein